MVRLSCGGCSTVLIFGLVGALFGGPRGFVLGIIFGVAWSLLFPLLFQTRRRDRRNQSHRFREMLENLLKSPRRGQRVPEEAVHALTGLFMAIVRQNDRGLREVHLQMARQVLRIYAAQGGVSTRAVMNSFGQWETAEIPVKELAGRVTEHYPREARVNFLHDMMMVAFADGQFQEDEEGILKFLTEQFELSDKEYRQAYRRVQERMSYSHGGHGRTSDGRSRGGRRRRDEPSLEDAYETLGLDPGADEDTVKSRYRELAREHHPDGVDDEDEAEAAQEKMVQINRAYKRIMESL